MIFVATLSYSHMSYKYFAKRQDREHLFHCMTNAFEYFGGIPAKVLFDNMKTIVTYCESLKLTKIQSEWRFLIDLASKDDIIYHTTHFLSECWR